MKLFLSSILLCIVFELSEAQWYTSYAPHGRDVSSSAIVSPVNFELGSGFEIAPEFEEFFQSTDYGLGWSVASTNNNTSQVMSLTFKDMLTGYGVCKGGKIVRTIDGGSNWTNVDSMLNRNFFKIIYVTPQKLFVVGGTPTGDSSTIMKSMNGGNSWSVIYNQPGSKLKSVFFIDSLKGYAVGENSEILKTTNGGTNWSPVSSPVANRSFNGIVFSGIDTGYIIGGVRDTTRTLLKTTNGGQNWTIIKDEAGGAYNDVSFTDHSFGYIVGDSATVLRTIDGGQNWQAETPPTTDAAQRINTVSFYNHNLGIMGGNGGYVMIHANTAFPEATTLNVSPVDTNNVILTGLVNTHGIPGQCYFYVSTDSTFPWQNTSAWGGVATTNSLINFAAGAGNLHPDSTYYYFLQVTSIAGTAYGDTLSFQPGFAVYTFQTNPPINVTDTSAQFTGTVNRFTDTLALYFDYGTTPAMLNSVIATPAIVNDNLLHSVTAQMQLQPHQLYHYRLRGVTANYTYTGSTFSFYTGTPFQTLQTLPATNVTDTTATLNALEDGFFVAANFYFEYGITPSMGSTLPATPSSINDSLQHQLSLNLTNLIPNQIYYYRVSTLTSAGNFTGINQSFYTGNYNSSQVHAVAAGNISFSSAQLNGYISHLNVVPDTVRFEFGTTLAFGTFANASPNIISDSLDYLVSAFVGGLLPDTQYYFRMKVQNSSGFFYSDTLNFITANTILSGTFIHILSPTNVTTTSAQLNAQVNSLSANPNTLLFEYGLTPLFGNAVNANPNIINDSLLYNVTATLTGLQNNALYYYRLKATDSNSNILYSDTGQLYTGNPIPNFDFQYWEHDTTEIPVGWNLLNNGFSKVQGHTGNYALRITGANVAMNGNIQEIIIGGQSLNTRPDSISMYLNFDITAGDSAGVMIFMYNSISLVSQTIGVVTGNTGGVFQKFTFPIDYANAQMPDSFTVAIFPSTSVFTGALHPNNVVILDDLSFIPASTPIVNGGFENWFMSVDDVPLSWYYMRYFNRVPTDTCNPMVQKTTFNNQGDYALALYTVNRNNLHVAFNVASDNNIFKSSFSGFPVANRFQTFNGYYKFIPDAADTMYVDVSFYNQEQAIGWAHFEQTQTTSSFTPFSVPVAYVSNLTPDSASINFGFNKKFPIGYPVMAIDKLSFDGFTGIEEPQPVKVFDENGIKVYPNPSRDVMILEMKNAVDATGVIQLFDLKGQLTSEWKIATGERKTEFTVSDLDAGLYLLRFVSGVNIWNKKIIVIR